MRMLPAGHVTTRIARVVRALLASRRSTGEWSRESVDALRRLVRARQAALLVADGDQQRVFGDQRPSALLQQLPPVRDSAAGTERGKQTEWVGASPGLAPEALGSAAPGAAQAGAPDVRARELGERYDMVGLVSPADDTSGLVGVCCTFAPALSERTALARLALLHAVQPALAAAARERLARRSGRDALRAILAALREGAALYTADGTLLDANDALAELVGADGAGALLREHMAHAARTTPGTLGCVGDGTTAVRTPHGQYRLRTRLIADLQAGPDALVLVIVEPLRAAAELTGGLAAGDGLRRRFHLTDREYEVVRLLHLGQSNSAIATVLGISPNTARHHTERVMMKLGIRSRAAIHRVLLESQRELGVEPGLADRPPIPASIAVLPRPQGTDPVVPRRASGLADAGSLHPAD